MPELRIPCSQNPQASHVLAWLKNHVSPKRLEHILGVEKTAHALALRYDENAQKAAWAGLLHDLAKHFSGQKLLSEADRFGIAVDSVCRQNPHLLHADIGAALARELFGETDAQVLNAITNHTLGHPEMDRLSQVLYLADWIEPMRKGPEVDHLRTLAWDGLEEAVMLGCCYVLEDLQQKGQPAHPRTQMTYDWLIQLSPKKVQNAYGVTLNP
jgi:predicted HD superfamily hydrolase involved in NAD metabolism